MDAAAREAQGGLEWWVTVEHEAAGGGVAAAWGRVAGFARKVWTIGADDSRKAVHGLKVGLSLALVSVFYYHTRPHELGEIGIEKLE